MTAKASTLSTLDDQMEDAWTAVGADEAVLEAFIDFDRELSVVAAAR